MDKKIVAPPNPAAASSVRPDESKDSETSGREGSADGSPWANKTLTSLLAGKLSPNVRRRLGKFRDRAVAVWKRQKRKISERVVAVWHRGDLIRLGEFFETDKWGAHRYLQHYQAHFQALRLKRMNLLEIGVGGYSDPRLGGNSLRMWKAYFPNVNVYGVDIYDKSGLEEDRIKVFQGSQIDEAFLRRVLGEIGGVDIVVDDGSHVNAHVIKTFETLFPTLKNPGIYVIEDTQTSYWPSFGGSSDHTGDPTTIMGYFTRLVHSLNHKEILRQNYSPTEFDQHIVAIHFYHNLIFIHKGENSEGSNQLEKYGNDARVWIEGPPNPCTM